MIMKEFLLGVYVRGMKKRHPEKILFVVCILIALAIIFSKSGQVALQEKEKKELVKLYGANPVVNPVVDAAGHEQTRSTRASPKVSKLREQAIQAAKDEHIENEARKGVLSSTLSAEVGKGEVLVTGGYQTADGNFHYTMLRPELVQSADGSKAIKMSPTQYALPPEVVQKLGLDSLSTPEDHKLQHGEVWSAQALEDFISGVGGIKNIGIMSWPTIIMNEPSDAATIRLDPPGHKGADKSPFGFYMSMTSQMTEDDAAFDIDLNVEFPKGSKAFAESGEVGP